ncbi:MAG: IS3 family transposase [Pseudonocardiaceae bacterium]
MSERYELIDAEKANFPIIKMSDWLEVSKSGFYDWRDRPASLSEQRRQELKTKIEQIFDDSFATYGYRRVHVELGRQGEDVSDELVRRLMRDQGLVACQPRPYKPVTTVQSDDEGIPDLVARDFTADAPGAKLVGDITYIPTWEGWLYLATVIDCYSKAVVGWSMSDSLHTDLVCAAIDAAASYIDLQPDCIFHSDRGSQYTSCQFRAHLAKYGARGSVGRTGVCWDNAMAESFFAALKNEWLSRMVFATKDQARREVVKYIEGFYNGKRLHLGLGYRVPLEVHNEWVNRQLAA